MVRTADRVVRSPRIAARRREVRAQRKRRRRRITIGLLLIAGIGVGALMLMRSGVFSLQKIDVVGAHTVSKQAIIDASGLQIGHNVLGVDLAAVAARVRALPGIADARVRRIGSLEVRIDVVERTAAIEVQSGGSKWYLDQQGVQIAIAPPDGGVPIIDLPPTLDVTVVSPTDEQTVLAIWAKMPQSMRARLVSFSLLPDHAVTFEVGPTTVVFGSADQVDAKLLAVQLVEKRVVASHHRLLRVDVRAPARPAARIS